VKDDRALGSIGVLEGDPGVAIEPPGLALTKHALQALIMKWCSNVAVINIFIKFV
jgi:hypothetical protein